MGNEKVEKMCKVCRIVREFLRREGQYAILWQTEWTQNSMKGAWIFLVVLLGSGQTERLWLRQDGNMYVTTHFFHVTVEVEITGILGTSRYLVIKRNSRVMSDLSLDQCDLYRNRIETLATRGRSVRDKAEAEVEDMLLDFAETRLNHTCQDLHEIVLREPHTRKPRQAVALAAAAGAFAFHEIEVALGWSPGADTKAQLAQHDKMLQRVTEKLQKHEEILSKITYNMAELDERHWRKVQVDYAVEAVDVLCAYGQRILRGMEAAREGRLTADLIPGWRIDELLEEAEKRGQKLPTARAWEIYQFPCSLVHSPRGLRIVVHCPITEYKMELLWLDASPVLLNAGRIMQVEGLENRFIAVNRASQTYVEGAQKELRLCFAVHNSLFCRHLTVRSDATETCLAAIAFSRQEAIATQCRWKRSERTWAVVPSGGGSYAIAVTEALGATMTCTNQSFPTKSFQLEKGWTNMTLAVGCRLSTPKFRIHGRPDQFWRPEATIHFGQDLLEMIEADHEERSSRLEEITDLLKESQSVKVQDGQYIGSHDTTQYSALVVVVVVVILMVVLKLRKWYQRRQAPRAPGGRCAPRAPEGRCCFQDVEATRI
jgi:hypothetical protein